MKNEKMIYVSGFAHNMQPWYKEKCVHALKALARLADALRCPDVSPIAQAQIDNLHEAVYMVISLIIVSVGTELNGNVIEYTRLIMNEGSKGFEDFRRLLEK